MDTRGFLWLALMIVNSAVPMPDLRQHQIRGETTALLRMDNLAAAPAGEKEPVTMRLSGVLQVRLRVEGPPTLEVETAEAPLAAPGWEVRSEPPEITRSVGRRIWQRTLHVGPQQPGACVLQVAPVRYRNYPSEDWQELTWKPLAVRVTTSVAQPDLSELRGPTPPEDPPESPSRFALLGLIALGVGMLVLGVPGARFALRHWHRRNRLTADQWAVCELASLEERNLPQANEVEGYFTQLAEIVRGYLERRFGLPASRQTTPEFLRQAPAAPGLTTESRALLEAILTRCDLAKFAQLHPSVEECRQAADMVRELIRGTTESVARG